MMEPDKNGEMVLTALHPGDGGGSEGQHWLGLEDCEELRTTKIRSQKKKYKILREDLDPNGLYLK